MAGLVSYLFAYLTPASSLSHTFPLYVMDTKNKVLLAVYALRGQLCEEEFIRPTEDSNLIVMLLLTMNGG